MSGKYDQFNKDLYAIIMDKSEKEAYDKIRAIKEQDGTMAYLTLYRWFTEISGLGLTSQATKLMHPDPPKKEEDLYEELDKWIERVRRLEAHGEKYVLPPLYKVTALRLLMVGKAKEHFEIWEADHKSELDGGFSNILNKIRDYARKKKLDAVATKAESKGADPMDLDALKRRIMELEQKGDEDQTGEGEDGDYDYTEEE